MRGPNVMAGYHELPDETAAAIGPGGWLRTGDLVTMDDRGYLRMTGRLKEMIVSGGENIFPVEIEAALLEHPDVAQAAVVGVPDQRWGEAAVAVIVPAGAAAAGPARTSRRSSAIAWRRSRCPVAGRSSRSCPAPRRARSRSTWSGTARRSVT